MNSQMEQKRLLNWIYQVSFSLQDLVQYLDTHCEDQEAIEYYDHLLKMRNQAMKDYTSTYGPLSLEKYYPDGNWKWATQEWPWEGGNC